MKSQFMCRLGLIVTSSFTRLGCSDDEMIQSLLKCFRSYTILDKRQHVHDNQAPTFYIDYIV